MQDHPPIRTGIVFALCLLAAVGMARTAAAQNNFELSELGPGELILNLNITEQTEVDQDQLTAVLSYSVRGSDRVALQDEVNSTIRAALDGLEDADGFEYSTGRYNVYPLSPERGRGAANPTWQASQSIQLTGRDSAALLEAAGDLQGAGLTMVNLFYSLSPQTRQEVSDRLLRVALGSLQSRADEAAELLGKGSAELVEVSLSHNQHNSFARGAMMETMAADRAAVDPPSAEPGKSTVMLSVSARALLSP